MRCRRYLALCRALIDGLGWSVTLLTPVNVWRSGEPDVDRWLDEGTLDYLPARGVRITSVDGVVVFLDLFSFVNTGWLLTSLLKHMQRTANTTVRSIYKARSKDSTLRYIHHSPAREAKEMLEKLCLP